MKKSLSLLVAIAMVFSMFATLVSAAETKTAGEKLQGYGIIKGTSEGLAEDAEWVRQDVTVLLSRLLQVEEKAAATANTHGFTDLDSKFYNGYVSWAKAEGYFTGEKETVFGVNNPITNQQFAAVLLRVLGVKDVPYAESLAKAVELKLVSADLVAGDNAVRGEIYTALVTALDFEIDGKKLGTILGLADYQITDLALVSTKAVVKSAVILEFNEDVKSIEEATIVDADGNEHLVDQITTKGKKATVALSDNLSSGKTYTVTLTNAVGVEAAALATATAEFKYQATTPVSVEFAATTIAKGDGNLKVIVKDENGDDITANHSDFTVESSNSSVVNGFDAGSTGTAIVNVILAVDDETNIETGNAIITVKEALSLNITDVSLTGNASDNNLEVNAKDTGDIVFTAEDQDNNKTASSAIIGSDDVNFKSLNPSRLVVDATTGAFTAVQAGTASVKITAKIGGSETSKTVVVTIKDEAVFSSISVDQSSVKIVNRSAGAAGTAIEYAVGVKTLDQFGKEIVVPGAVITADAPANNLTVVDPIAVGFGGDSKTTVKLVDPSSPVVQKNGTVTVKIVVKSADGKKSFTKSVSVSRVDQNGEAGYVAEIDNATIEVNPASTGNTKADKDMSKTANITVYAKDKNGNKFGIVTADATFEAKDGKENVATIDANGEITAVEAGTEVFNVIIETAKVATVTVKVVDTKPTLTTVSQAKTTITVTGTASNLQDQLFGTDGKGNALVGYDQYGAKIVVAAGDYDFVSSNKDVVNAAGAFVGEGKATVTVLIKDKFFVVNVSIK